MTTVIYCVAVLGVLAILLGLMLAVAAKKFAVPVDERQEAILGCLPGANCGGCGFAGCSAYASAVVNDGAATNCCLPGGAAVAQKVSEIMGVTAEETARSVAFVRCSGVTAKKKLEYSGISDCTAAMRLGGGSGANECPDGCLGFGACAKACPFGAMSVVDGVAVVDREKCTGCMSCAGACPKGLIIKVPYDAKVTVPCASKQKGVAVRKYCDSGCIACTLCQKNCPNDAIHITDNLAQIDYDKCVSCGVCAEKCPRKLIVNLDAPKAEAAE